jgi:hypothetical protein
MIERLLQRLQAGDLSGLSGTDLLVRLPISQKLLNTALAARPASPVQDIRLELLADNRALLHLEVEAPIVGRTRRELHLRINGDLRPGERDTLDFDIIDGLKLFDKPIIQFARGVIEQQLPAGIELNSKRLRIHFSRLVTALGYGYVLPLINAARLESYPEQLQLLLHLKAD